MKNPKKKLTVKDYQQLLARVEKAEASAAESEKSKANGIFTGGTPANPAQTSMIHTTARAAEGSIEQKALASFGCKDARGLLHVNTGLERFKHVPDDIKRTVISLKHEFETARVIAQIFYDEKFNSHK